MQCYSTTHGRCHHIYANTCAAKAYVIFAPVGFLNVIYSHYLMSIYGCSDKMINTRESFLYLCFFFVFSPKLTQVLTCYIQCGFLSAYESIWSIRVHNLFEGIHVPHIYIIFIYHKLYVHTKRTKHASYPARTTIWNPRTCPERFKAIYGPTIVYY